MNEAMVLDEPVEGPAAWRGPGLRDDGSWLHHLSEAHVDEIEAALAVVRDRGLAVLDVGRDDFPLPTLSPVIQGWVDELDAGRGFVWVRGLPVERYTEEEASIIYWGIGQHMGVPVSQNAAGDLLGHVRDTGRSTTDPSVRGYQTSERLEFHTDGSDIVGLLCLRVAKEGGESAIVSSVTVYNEVLRRRPDLAPLYFDPFPLDRRNEEAPGDIPFFPVPIGTLRDGRLSTLYIRSFIESSQRHPDAPRLTGPQRELLDLIDDVANDPEFHLCMSFVPGDMQFVKNATILHSRTEFVDFDSPEDKRHLLRLWLTLHRNAEGGRGRGGIPATRRATVRVASSAG